MIRLPPLSLLVAGIAATVVIFVTSAGAKQEPLNGRFGDVSLRGAKTGDILFVATRSRPFAGQLYAINPDGSGRRRVPTGSKHPWGARWAPDGRHIAFEAGASGPGTRDAIFVIAPDGTRRVRIGQDSYPADFRGTRPGVSFAWSPNGRRLAYSVIEDGKPRLYIANLTGKKLVDLTPPEGARPTTRLGGVTWSRGGWIGFLRFGGDPATSNCCSLTYELVRPSGKGLRSILRIYDYPHDGPGISWSPNGAFVAVTTQGWDRRDPKLAVAAAGSARWHRIKGFAPTSRVAWSPDSARFAFTELKGTALHFISLRANGTAARKLTSGVPVGIAEWAPNGRRILIVVGSRDGRSIRDLEIVPAGGGKPSLVTRVPAGVAITSVSWRG